MKDKFDESWQKRWIAEIDESAPPLADFVKNEPLPTVEPKRRAALAWISELLSTARARAMAGALAMLIVTVVAVLIFRPTHDPVPTPATVVAVQINPSALFTADTDGNVCSVVAINDDADMVMALPDFTDRVIGKPLEVAIAAYADMCSSLGFIDYSGDAVRVMGVEGDAELDALGTALSSYFKSHGMLVAVDLSLVSEADFRSEFEINGIDGTLADTVHAMIANCCEREASGKEVDELRAEYEREVLDGELNLYIKEALEVHIDELPEPWASILGMLIDALSKGELVDHDELIRICRQVFGDGCEDERIEHILGEPTSIQEYIEKRREYSQFRVEELRRKYEDSYLQERESIADGVYDDFISDITERYGSLGEYFAQRYYEDPILGE